MTQDITVTDMFCGAGGSTTGAVLAGADVRLAINHWKRAIETHNTNYPNTTHVLTDLHKANPRRFPSTTFLIASPECTAQSIAKGCKRREQGQLPLWDEGASLEAEAEERSRCTMWTPLDWAECHDYQAVILENVVDAHLWRPFDAWLQAWKSLDYDFEIVYLNSMFAHPTPQSRDRMYFVAWKRKNRRPDLAITPLAYCAKCSRDVNAVQSWKNPARRRGKYRQQYVYCCPNCAGVVTPYYFAAANAIDWGIPAPRIGDRARPLREKTVQRIAYGLQKCAPAVCSGEPAVLPFLINLTHTTIRPIAVDRQPFPTQTTYDSSGIAVPPALLLQTSHGECGHTSYTASSHESPFPTQTTRQDMALAFPSWLMSYYNRGQMTEVSQAVPTVTTLERHALVTGSAANTISVEDCGFRMLMPHEIQAAMAFPTDYILTGTRREQTRQLGNAVTPPVMKLLMQRVIASLAA
jgi:DNA (cytosine-5)-methyltransferase 1